ncbi:hypothetical protein ACQP2T_63920 (plasmid) [Nonomuraea sp. CA-143628]|uniref:hypothetical protein n=1 Tax=Nonomuraea sp. CA-143628 TaxID=3239997 RepID=UPI003D94286F
MTATIETSETMTAREIAKAIRVAPRTRKFVMKDREGWDILGQYDVPRYARVLCSLMRSDLSDVTSRIRLVAMALHKSISTGRMNAVCSNLIQERYTPYQLCALVAQIARDCDETTIGGICDTWLSANIVRLCGSRVEELNFRF